MCTIQSNGQLNSIFIDEAMKTILDDSAHDIIFSSGATWRRQRYVINPAFTAPKMKTGSPRINASIADLKTKLSMNPENIEQFNIYSYYKRMAMDVICHSIVSLSGQLFLKGSFCLGRCAFGIDTELQNNPDSMHFEKVGQLFDENTVGKSWLFR